MNEFDAIDEVSMRTMRGDTTEGTLGRIDQYDIIRKLGGGGFGVVYLVRDTLSNAEYAIKTLHPLLKSNLEEMENLKSQFLLVSKLSHPNIASALILHPVKEAIYATEEVRKELRLATGDFVMVMKYAPGVTLSKWRKQFQNGIVPVDKAIDICKQIASALDYAHSEKIIHRDIKPGNIMIETRDNGSIIARVLDFGLAAEIRSSMSRVSTDKGDTSGTRPYMAPEQWQGKKQNAATDQYALAVVFYELVSGTIPFAGAFETGDFMIMLNSVKTEEPDFLEELSEEQNQVLLKALSKSPKDRYDSCSTFLDVMLGKVTVQPKANISSSHSNPKSIVCKKCNCENEVDSTFCVGCGAKIERDDICPNCGATLSENQMFCKKCGSKTPLCLDKEAEHMACEETERKVREEIERKVREEIGKPLNVAGIDIVRIPNSSEHKGLYFGKYQITQGQWQEIMGNNPSYSKGDLSRPVENVSWNDCQKFISKLNARPEVMSAGITFRLPTSEEWEYACRAGSNGKYGLLADGQEGTLDDMGWYRDNSEGMTHPVGQKTPNAWGLYDMHGNVWEWTASADGEDRISRGGSYYNDAFCCGAGFSYWNNLDGRHGSLGFRLVAERMGKSSRVEQKEVEFLQEKSIGEGIKAAGIDIVSIPDSAEHKGLYFGKYQVTQAQWQDIMGNNPSHFEGDLSRPVEQVSWNDCQEFIKKLNALTEVKTLGITFRLPTEEEWEYACRAGSTGKYGLLADGQEGTLDDMGWYRDNSEGMTHPVGQKTPNAWGLYDMHGNVWEWTASADGGFCIRRGGSFYDSAFSCGSDSRYWLNLGFRDLNLGLRLVAFRTNN